jgi:hypothetical protein
LVGEINTSAGTLTMLPTRIFMLRHSPNWSGAANGPLLDRCTSRPTPERREDLVIQGWHRVLEPH